MRRSVIVLLSLALAARAGDTTPWQKILSAVGLNPTTVAVIDGTDEHSTASAPFVMLQGFGPAAEKLGVTAKADIVSIRQIVDDHAPKMQIIWEEPVKISRPSLQADWIVFAVEKWTNIPVLAGKRTPHGAVLWLATSPGEQGFERYPYLLQALTDLGLEFPLRANNLWAFFDSSYRIRADVDYLARRWRSAGVGVLHVAAWHNLEGDLIQDQYLAKLIEACHRNAILVYAWLELPHVSEEFWADHPEWREKTAAGQDAQLDWRKLMNLQNADCRRAAQNEIAGLLHKFDWDGVNLAELYFESLEGSSNPARFTPMNEDVRSAFRTTGGFDPQLLFDPTSSYSRDPQALRKFLDYRAQLASRMQSDWLDYLDQQKKSKPYLDVVLTHIDDRFEPGIRDSLGADVAQTLPSIEKRRSTLLVEDPATLWSLGPERYAKLADKYHELAPRNQHIAVDINVVERYQDVYPTKKQTGIELLQQVHQAASSFSRVALYFENSIEKQDLALLPVAAITGTAKSLAPDQIAVNLTEPSRLQWTGSVEIDGKLWPVQSSTNVIVPAGKHVVTPAATRPPIRITDFNGDLHSASISDTDVVISYSSRSRAIAALASPARRIEIDNMPLAGDHETVLLPAGDHVVTFAPQ